MLVTFECTVVGQRLKNLSDVRRLQAPKQVRWLAIAGSISAGTLMEQLAWWQAGSTRASEE